MKRIYILGLFSLLVAWCLGFFVFHAGPSIHTLLGLAVLVLLHGILKSNISVPLPVKMLLEFKYYWYLLVFRKDRREDEKYR